MSKSIFGHSPSSEWQVDHDDSFDATFSNFNDPFKGPHPSLVLYSSDLDAGDLRHGHLPEVITEAGSGSHSSGGSTLTSGSTLVTGTSGTGLAINVTWDSSVSAAPTGFTNVVLKVAQYFVDHFSDPATVNINVGYGEAGGYSLGGALGMSLTYLQSSSYTQIKNALSADQTTAADGSAVASLLGDPTSGGNYWISTAEAKAMGLSTSTTSIDGFVGFSSSSNIFDFDNSNGVTAGQYDFFGTVAHEFSEVMGRMLLVGGTIGNTSHSYDALDLFHYSAPGTHDLSGSTAGYFSADNGTTNLHNFNSSPFGGDRGDWASSSTPDAFDAFGTPGVVSPISSSDLTALDVIGWNAGASAPPPSLPDLTVSNFALDASGTSVTFRYNNIGTATADANDHAASVYLSNDSAITTSDQLLASVAALSLPAGGSVAESGVLVTLSAQATAGTYYLGVVADPNGAISEGNEFNNVSNVIPVILGTTGANSLTGTSGSNMIFGFDGNDTITGGAGADILSGGAGNDHFRFTARSDGLDNIVDFTQGSDVLDFSRSAFGKNLATGGANFGTLASSHFTSNSDGHATAATAQFIYNTTTDILSFDQDGTGGAAAVQMVLLGNNVTLTYSDIHLV